MSITIRDGGLLTKDPSDTLVYEFDWDTQALAEGVTILSSSFTLQGTRGDITTTPLTKDQESLTGGDRRTQVRLSAGARGSRWRVNNQITTSETPAQTIERSFFLLVEER